MDQDKTGHPPVQPVDLERRPPANHGRSKLEKILFILLVLSVAGVIALSVYIGIKYDELTAAPGQDNATKTKNAAEDVCNTPECVTAASNLIQSIDDTVSPCDDFFQFSCGKWKTRFKIPEGLNKHETTDRLVNDIATSLRGLLEAPVSQGDQDYIRKVKDFYVSCMDIEQINQRWELLKGYIKQLGGWPMVDANWNPNSFSLTDLLVKVSRYAVPHLLEISVERDNKDSSKHSLYMDQITTLGVKDFDQYFNKSHQYHTLMVYTVHRDEIINAANKVGKCSENDVDDVIDFELKLYEIITKRKGGRSLDLVQNAVTQKLKDINNVIQTPNVGLDFTKYMVDSMAWAGVDITEDEVIINLSPQYLRDLKKLLDQTNRKTIANYLVMWFVNTIHAEIINSDVLSDGARNTHCLALVDGLMGFAAARLFIDHKFSHQARESVNEMIDNLKLAFNKNLQELHWIDNVTRAQAKIKNDNMNRHIGYPDWNTDDDYLSKMYGSVEVKRDIFFQNGLNAKQGLVLGILSKLRKPADNSQWHQTPQTVNAYYNRLANDITFPGGFLQPPLVHPNYPNYLNYGGVGMVIGHEIIHGFDNSGHEYDKDGNYKNWWTNATCEKYKQKVQCFIDQYSQFSKNINGEDHHVDGVLTQNENIADNGGIKISYLAYKNWEAQQEKPEPGLPGLPYNSDQLFFINYGQTECGLYKDDHIISSIKTSTHPIGEFRVLGTIRNMPDFGKVFNCMKDSKMNPINKCSLW